MVRHGRRAAVLLAGLILGVVGVLGMSAPAHADENGSEWCFLSTGSITVKNTNTGAVVSSVPFGTDLTVSWGVNPACPDLAVYLGGLGFAPGEFLGLGGTRSQIWATPPNGSHTLTWTLVVVGMDSSTPTPITLATRTIGVT